MSQICACVKIGLAPDVPAMETITDELAESPLNALRKTLRISLSVPMCPTQADAACYRAKVRRERHAAWVRGVRNF